jgi:hypothetical protein
MKISTILTQLSPGSRALLAFQGSYVWEAAAEALPRREVAADWTEDKRRY